ncbi:hypothetical protein Bhyg_17945 [Pseudolycoriella hygida]|uniref:Uncharacterized protein n=1 Tax=Pseudolycoriella hygida TaxID=35572 RepID=A0A9Q0MLK3_9DIPT|nr:hypothetical protein Bhyg_17945 [Pseudolycoriella hygida]
MPMTPSESQKRYMTKLKASGRYEAFKKNDAYYHRVRRAKQKAELQQLPEAEREERISIYRAKRRKISADFRERQKQMELSNTTHNVSMRKGVKKGWPQNTKSALSKSSWKEERVLPSSSENKKAVIFKYWRPFDTDEEQDSVSIANKPTTSKGLKPDVIAPVQFPEILWKDKVQSAHSDQPSV